MIVMICIIAVILICCILHRRKMRAQLLKIEKELEMARAYVQSTREKRGLSNTHAHDVVPLLLPVPPSLTACNADLTDR